MLYLINKYDKTTRGFPWGFMSHMNSHNRKLVLLTEVMSDTIDYELDDGDVLAVYDGQWGYRYEDTIELKRRL